ncbi:MAG: response regulator [Bacteroidetes bacterium]|nr:response regulator [Bacteroidota bacterium]
MAAFLLSELLLRLHLSSPERNYCFTFAAHLKRFIFIALGFLFASISVAQELSAIPEINSLPRDLSSIAYTDSLFSIAKKYKDIDAIKAIRIYEAVIDNAKKNGYTKLRIESNNEIGHLKSEQNQLPEAYKYHQEAFKLAVETGDSAELALTYNRIGDVYKRLRLQDKAVQYIKKAVTIARLRTDSFHISAFSDLMGHVYMDWAEESNKFNHYYEALKNYKYSLHINEKRKDLLRLSISYINLGNAYMVMYKHGGERSFLTQSINYSLKGQSLATGGDFPIEWAINTINLGEAHYLLGDYGTAIGYFDQCLPVFEKQNKRLWYAAVLVDIALVHEKKKEFDKALELIKKANKITMEYDQVEPYINYKHLAELYAEKKDYKAAYEATNKYHELFNRDLNTRTMLEMEGKQLELDNERKDKEIELLNKENKYNAAQHKKDILVNYALIAFSVLMIIVLILVYNRSRLLKRSKELAEHARRMQQQFLANTSHEIRTPMNGIIGMADQLAHTDLNDDQKNSLDIIKKSAYSLLGIIDDVLDLSKIQAGRIELKERKFSLDNFLHDIKKLLVTQAAKKNLELTINRQEGLPGYLIGDDNRLRQVLINLLSNAIKFTSKGSVELRLSLDKKQDEKVYIKFSVTDTGIGIPLKKTEEIFTSFVQLEDPGQRTQGGTGLGLAISKSLVELMGGRITVKSKPGEGSTFEFTLPFKTTGPGELAVDTITTGTNHPENRDLEGISVLVVEDNLVNQQVIVKILERWRVENDIASLAVEAFELLGAKKYDIILMDIELPGINGWQATEYIRTKFREPVNSIPILALTAYAYDSEKEKCLQCGMNDVLIKPYSEEELYLKMRKLLYNEEYIAPLSRKNSIEELEDRYSNDSEALQELYELFLTEMPVYLADLKASHDPEAISKLAHKIKSPVSLFGETETIEKLRRLNANTDLSDEDRSVLIENVVNACAELIKRVHTRLKKLKT